MHWYLAYLSYDGASAELNTSLLQACSALITIHGCCRVPSTLRPLLSSTTAPKDELYSEEQMRSVLASYSAANDLQIDSGTIKLDKLMISHLFNKKEPQMEGDVCSVEDVFQRLLGKLQLFHKVTRVTEQVSL